MTEGVPGIFRRLFNAFKQVEAKREATFRDWTEKNQFDRWKAICRVTRRAVR